MKKMRNVLRSLRVREGLTQEELAKKLGIARSTIGMYENGERVPPLKILERFADFFNVDMNYITGRTEKEYYHDLQTKQIAQGIFENRDLRALFDASRNATPEDLKIVRDLLIKNKKKDPGSPGVFVNL